MNNHSRGFNFDRCRDVGTSLSDDDPGRAAPERHPIAGYQSIFVASCIDRYRQYTSWSGSVDGCLNGLAGTIHGNVLVGTVEQDGHVAVQLRRRDRAVGDVFASDGAALDSVTGDGTDRDVCVLDAAIFDSVTGDGIKRDIFASDGAIFDAVTGDGTD